MRILVSNDDGYLAPGLAALAGAMRPFGTVTVVAPEQNSSGASNSLTLSRPLTVSTAPDGVIFINGTPSDCVHIALTGLLEQRPDLIVSGINNGQNMVSAGARASSRTTCSNGAWPTGKPQSGQTVASTKS